MISTVRLAMSLLVPAIMFTLANPALAGRLEEIKDRFNQIQSDYDETKRYVDSGNTDSAKSAVSKMIDKTATICPYVQDINDRVSEIPSLRSTWKDVKYWCLELATKTAVLKNKLGSGKPNDEMSKVTEAFLKLGDSLKSAYDKFKDFGKNWLVVCSDMCR